MGATKVGRRGCTGGREKGRVGRELSRGAFVLRAASPIHLEQLGAGGERRPARVLQLSLVAGRLREADEVCQADMRRHG